MQVGQYEIVGELGRGGMGVVYEGRHVTLGRRVAIKLILRTAANPRALTRFVREAELLARIQHPHVLRVHELGQSPKGPYLVTEFLEGDDLQGAMRHGPLAPERAARVSKGPRPQHAGDPDSDWDPPQW